MGPIDPASALILVRVTAVIRVSQRGECREGKLRTSVTDQLSSGCSPITRRFR
jgi:hypothetical protein